MGGGTHARTENIYSIFRDKLLLLGEHGYGNNYALTDSVLQVSRDMTKNQLFGSADVNVKYASAVAARMRDLGHEVKLVFSTRREVLTAVSSIVLSEELARRKKLKQSFNGAERKKYVDNWKLEKEKFLYDALGYEDAMVPSIVFWLESFLLLRAAR